MESIVSDEKVNSVGTPSPWRKMAPPSEAEHHRKELSDTVREADAAKDVIEIAPPRPLAVQEEKREEEEIEREEEEESERESAPPFCAVQWSKMQFLIRTVDGTAGMKMAPPSAEEEQEVKLEDEMVRENGSDEDDVCAEMQDAPSVRLKEEIET